MAEIEVIVSIDQEHQNRLDEVADRLRAAGLRIDKRLKEVGMITGSIEKSKMNKLSGIKGVSYVEPSSDVTAF